MYSLAPVILSLHYVQCCALGLGCLLKCPSKHVPLQPDRLCSVPAKSVDTCFKVAFAFGTMSSDGHVSDRDRKVVPTNQETGSERPEEDDEPSLDGVLPEGHAAISEDDEPPSDEQAQSTQRNHSRKRKSPLDEPYWDAADSRPQKRATGSFNRAYLDLLNEDIMHAASRYVPLTSHLGDKRRELPASQIGMTVWSSAEKERFFEALGRLGRDAAPGIARRIRTKGEMQVRQYMKLIEDSIAQRQQFDQLPPLVLADFPAATELSHECCQALEEVADSLSLRQDHFETTLEQEKHGNKWIVSRDTCKHMAEDETKDHAWETVDIFNVPKWLTLSERFFMNSPSEQGNWQAMEGDTPSVRLSTLTDFRSLALTLTRRLVAASLFTAGSRVRAERGSRPYIEEVVKDKDVHAAAISLGLSTRKPPLMKTIRKLGLQVYEEDPPDLLEEGLGQETLSYQAVEDALADIGPQPDASCGRRPGERMLLSSDEDSLSSDSAADTGTDSELSNHGGRADGADGGPDADVAAEANEAILYCGIDPPQTKRGRQALFRRIQAEREQEAYADAVDAQAGYREEACMWAMLTQQPSRPLVDPGTPAVLKRLSAKQSVDAGYLVGRNWRAHTKRTSEWEAGYGV